MESLASPHKEGTFYHQENSHGGKNMSFALPPAPEPWFLCSRRLERREGNICISLGSVTGTSIITGTMGSARAGRARDCSAPGFIFVRAWSGGGGDQVTVPEERLASPVLPPCVQHVRGSRERAGMGSGAGRAGRLLLLTGSFLLDQPAPDTRGESSREALSLWNH